MIRPGAFEALNYFHTGADSAEVKRTTDGWREVMDRRDIHFPEGL